MKNNGMLCKTGRFVMAAALVILFVLVVQPVFASNIFYTNDRVNFRTGPGVEHERLKTLPVGAKVEVLEHDVDEWSKVIYKEQTGYIKSEFLDDELPDNAPEISPGGVVLMTWPEAKKVVKIGATIRVYDIRSGLTYYIKSFSNGAHADVVTLTAEDTNTMKRTFGSWSWSIRPLWVTVGDITIAAAIHGMPHGGGAIPGTGISGHFCLHFKGSSVHNGNRSYNNEMQAAVQAAYNASL